MIHNITNFNLLYVCIHVSEQVEVKGSKSLDRKLSTGMVEQGVNNDVFFSLHVSEGGIIFVKNSV